MRKQNLVKYFLIVMMTILLISFFVACGNENKLEGTWDCEQVVTGYPDSLTLNEDGTGVGDGISLSWHTEGDTLYVDGNYIDSYKYTYSVSGNILRLDGYQYNRQ